jgi:glutamine synthetase
MLHLRLKALEELQNRQPRALSEQEETNINKLWECDVFGEEELRERLTESAYKKFKRSLESDEPLGADVADQIAAALKEWALSKGATHFAHWFQPLHGLTAEKHDSFITFVGSPYGRNVQLNLTGKQLIKGEPDASSFPNGGLRSTFEARGYTAWDMSSPSFIKRGPSGNVLCIPTAFVSWTGDSLDTKTPLLKSNQAISKSTVRLMRLLGDTETTAAYSNMGIEQEFFVVDSGFYTARPDLVACGRSLLGAPPPKGQQLEDHYFGTMDRRVISFIQDVERRLWKLGVPVTTRHNEVAPSQYEMAPIYERVSVACDHNMIMMETLREVAPYHGLTCLLHEKPFAGVNGSGKHNNWSIETNTGENLMDPGKTPQANTRFMLVLAALVRAVSLHGDLLRCAIAVPGNEHRLGENEAPPAIISIYIGDTLAEVVEEIVRGPKPESLQKSHTMKWGVNCLPEFKKDSSDRNRTSPFAFCGNKFEFRAVGSGQSCARPGMIINTIMAESLDAISDEVEMALKETNDIGKATTYVVKKMLTEHGRAIFNGNGYSEEWRIEAGKRGLWNLPTIPEAVKELTSEKNVKIFTNYNVLTQREVHSLQHVVYEALVKHVAIEADALFSMTSSGILPAALEYKQKLSATLDPKSPAQANLFSNYNEKVSRLIEAIEGLKKVRMQGRKFEEHDLHAQAVFYRQQVMDAMKVARAASDDLEEDVDDKLWPYPKYSEILLLK